MADHNIGVGSIVQLNSGSPDMTVVALTPYAGGVQGASCAYFDEKGATQLVPFPLPALTLIPPPATT